MLTTRYVLKNLGVEDMGIYAVVNSVVAAVTMFGGTLERAAQRFIVYETGKKENDINLTFNTCLNILYAIAFIFFILLESIGLFLLDSKLNIPAASKINAIWAYQFCIVSFLFQLISIPYNSVLIAHEKMKAFAGITIINAGLTCMLAFLLSIAKNRLLFYALGVMLISLLERLLYRKYCKMQFPEEVKYKKSINMSLMKRMGIFFGTTSISTLLYTITNQSIVWSINMMFGVALNAVYSIANQLKNTMLSFSMNINRAISPQITKTYANGMMREHKNLVNVGMRLNAFMMQLILFPFIFYADTFMQLWLKDVPEYTVFFVQLIAFSAFFDCLMQSIGSAVFATGQIKAFLLVTRAFYLLVLPLMYFAYKYTLSPKSLICSVVLMDLMAMVIQMIIVVKQKIVDLKDGIVIPMVRIGFVSILSAGICASLRAVLPHDVIGLVILCFLHTVTILPIMIIIGTTSGEKVKIRQKITSSHIFHRFIIK